MTEPVKADEVLAYSAAYRDAVDGRKDRDRRLVAAEAAIQRVREVCEDAEKRQLERASVLAMRVLDIVNGTDEYGAWCRALGIDGGAE